MKGKARVSAKRKRKYMTLVRNSWMLLLSLLVASAADKDAKFSVQPASSYPNRQTGEGVTIAAQVFETAGRARTAFGKVNPNEHGVLPVLVVIQNDTGKAIRLDEMRVEYLTADRSQIEATPPEDVPYIYGNKNRKMRQSPIPTGIPSISKSKNPLAAFEIQSRAFAAKMLPPGESAHGFYYFQTGHRSGSKLYITGLKVAGGKDLFFFEIPLENVAR